jgi:hypothetical protein
MSVALLESGFPSLKQHRYTVTSPATSDYNCFAWALSNTKRWWSPSPSRGYHWPRGIPADCKLTTFVKLYALEGFAPSDNARVESGFEKLAVYCDSNGEVTHVARQTQSGAWTSKLGDWEDIEHESLSAVEGELYGQVKRFLKRKTKT